MKPHAEAACREVCAACPSLKWAAGAFDVLERPSKEAKFSGEDGCRRTAAGVPVCVHPHKVGLPPGAWASEGLPLPWILPMPDDPEGITSWLVSALASAPADEADGLVDRACTALMAHPGVDVTEALRAALAP